MSASNWRYSESPPKHLTSETMIKPRKHSASPLRRTARTSGNHENSPDHSPPRRRDHHQKVANKVVEFPPSWEIKGSSEGSHVVVASNTRAMSPLKVSSRPNESPEGGGIVVPKLGDWDESNPSSGEAYTDLFNKVIVEKQSNATRVPMIIDDSIYLNNFHHDNGSNKSSSKCSCFKWGKKRG